MTTRLNRGDNFEMYRNIESLRCVPGANIVSLVSCTTKTNKLSYTKKKIPDLSLLEAKGWGGGIG